LTQTASFQEMALLENSDKLQIDEIDDNDDLNVSQEGETVDCPDCFDTMVKIYDSDKIRYRCENCDLMISAGWL
jgi:Zn finger protein HypA/HybF involved in hydrogenase expression